MSLSKALRAILPNPLSTNTSTTPALINTHNLWSSICRLLSLTAWKRCHCTYCLSMFEYCPFFPRHRGYLCHLGRLSICLSQLSNRHCTYVNYSGSTAFARYYGTVLISLSFPRFFVHLPFFRLSYKSGTMRSTSFMSIQAGTRYEGTSSLENSIERVSTGEKRMIQSPGQGSSQESLFDSFTTKANPDHGITEPENKKVNAEKELSSRHPVSNPPAGTMQRNQC